MVKLLTMYDIYANKYQVIFNIYGCFMCIYKEYNCLSDPICEYKVPCDQNIIIW